MIKKLLPFLVVAAFVAGPVAAPVFAGSGDVKKCEKIKDPKAKAACEKKATTK
jgi:hypothetical protein